MTGNKRIPTERMVLSSLSRVVLSEAIFTLLLDKPLKRQERERIEGIYERYRNLSPLAKMGSHVARNLLCKALYNESYMSCSRENCPVDWLFD